MYESTSFNYVVSIDEDMLDLFDDEELNKLKDKVLVQVSFRRKLQRYRGGNNSLAPIILESFDKSIILDADADACDLPLSPFSFYTLLDHYPGIPRSKYLNVFIDLKSKVRIFLDQQKQQKQRMVVLVVPISIDIEVCRSEYYGELENIAGVLSSSTINALKNVTTTVVGSSSSLNLEDCIICLEKISDADNNNNKKKQISRMPCSHLYHTDCILHWLTKSFTCPVCRFQMPYENPEDCLY